jgi:hypothetical protein
MAREATELNKDANGDYSNYEQQDRSQFQSGLNNFNSQVSKMDGMGNPYESKDYLTNQNKLVSGGMHATNDTAAQQMRDAANRTGTNSAALDATISSNARNAQITANTMQAQQASADQDKYLAWEQNLAQDKLAGTQAAGSMYSTDASGRTAALGNLQSGQNASMDMWGKITSAGMQAGGAAGAAALKS